MNFSEATLEARKILKTEEVRYVCFANEKLAEKNMAYMFYFAESESTGQRCLGTHMVSELGPREDTCINLDLDELMRCPHPMDWFVNRASRDMREAQNESIER